MSRLQTIIKLLKKNYPNANCALNHESPFQLLIATILSAQCTDQRVNLVTPKLFEKYPDPHSMAQAKIQDLEKLVQSTGFYKNKAKSLKGTSQVLSTKFKGEVPAEMNELIQLPGVGRKTANVVLGNAYNIASGVVVDTHVGRLAKRLGLSKAKTPEKIEQDLIKIVPKKHWVVFSHWLILHGRGLCSARKPKCEQCFLADHCPKVGVH